MMCDTCGCCQGVQRLTPLPTENRPGLSAIAYRVGTHGTFLESMQAALTGRSLAVPLQQVDQHGHQVIARIYPLERLTARSPGDFGIALLDGWATVADVLTFYQERIANEGYLRTATERRSIVELVRLIGYEPKPGVAASVFLAYTLDPNAAATIPAGSSAMSVPEPDQLPQTFETSDPVEARAEWNTLAPRLRHPTFLTQPALMAGPFGFYLAGSTTGLRPGDALLFVFGPLAGQQVFSRIGAVEPEPLENRTHVILQDPVPPTPASNQFGADFIERLQDVILAARQLQLFRVSPTSAMTIRVLALLDAVETRIKTDPMTALSLVRTKTLPLLQSEENRARAQKWPRLTPWVHAVSDALQRVVDQFSPRLAGLAVPGGPVGGGGSSPVSGFARSLLKRPSIPPANATQLNLDAQTAFGPHSDVAARMLVSSNPALASTLYTAIANAQVTQPPALDDAYALRIKAAPFGHNAPRRAVFSSRGAIIGSEEWPLASITTTVRITSNTANQFLAEAMQQSVTCTVIVRSGVAEVTQQLLITNSETPVSQGGVRITTRRNAGSGQVFSRINVVVEIQRDQFEPGAAAVLLTRTWRIDVVQEALDVSPRTAQNVNAPFDDGLFGPYRLNRNSAATYATNIHRVTMDWVTDGGESLTITDEQIVPPIGANILALDTVQDQIVPGSWVVVRRAAGQPVIARVLAARTVTRSGYGLTASVTELRLDANWLTTEDHSLAPIRDTVVWALSEPLELADEPIEDDIQGGEIELDGVYQRLMPGRWAIVSGERTDVPGTGGVHASELVMLAGVTHGVQQVIVGNEDITAIIDRPGDTVHTTIRLATSLAYTYRRDTLKIYGNVVKATHGTTHREPLGSGDSTQPFQAFTLKRQPLTHVTATTPSGTQNTLEVRVNAVQWHEARSLAFLGPRDRGFVTRTDDDGKTTVTFGNGRRGVRPPTGAENIAAVYRSGIGKFGNLGTGQIMVPLTRPPGVSAVTNPLPSTGGADRESRDDARRNAPTALYALDRLVSVRDFEDFARSFAGIGKASARRLTDGRRQLTHLTVAGADDIPIDPASDLYRSLVSALRQFGDPATSFLVTMRRLKLLVIQGSVLLEPGYLWETVVPRVTAALHAAFGFNQRGFGQNLLAGQVSSVIQRIEGIRAVDLDVLAALDEDKILDLVDQPGGLAAGLGFSPRISADLARPDPAAATLADRIRPAELIVLSPAVPETLILKGVPA